MLDFVSFHVVLLYSGVVMLPCGAATMLKHDHQAPLSGMCIIFGTSKPSAPGFFIFLRLKTFCFSLLGWLICVWLSPPCSFHIWRKHTVSGYYSNMNWLTADWWVSETRHRIVASSIRDCADVWIEIAIFFFFVMMNSAALRGSAAVGTIASRKDLGFTLRSRLLCVWRVHFHPQPAR